MLNQDMVKNMNGGGDVMPTFRYKLGTTLLFILLAFGLGAVPFLIGNDKAPPGQVFLGQVNNYPDYNLYFSFIHQSHDGRWLFDNRVTYETSRPILLNLEWLALGKIMRAFHLSENFIIQLWRFIGSCSLIGGFAFLASAYSLSRTRWILALTLFSLGGGFGFLISTMVALHMIPPVWLHSWAIDMWGNLHSFQVIMGNPHAALGTGIELIGFGLFIRSDQKGSLAYAIWSGVVMTISGLIRPYDLLSFGFILCQRM